MRKHKEICWTDFVCGKTSLNLCPVSRLTTQHIPTKTNYHLNLSFFFCGVLFSTLNSCFQLSFRTNLHIHIKRPIACVSVSSTTCRAHCWTNAIAYWINTHLSQRNLWITPFIKKPRCWSGYSHSHTNMLTLPYIYQLHWCIVPNII